MSPTISVVGFLSASVIRRGARCKTKEEIELVLVSCASDDTLKTTYSEPHESKVAHGNKRSLRVE